VCYIRKPTLNLPRKSWCYTRVTVAGINNVKVDIPRQWYNIMADLDKKPPPPLHPQTHKPLNPEDLSPLFAEELIN
jgi:predicted alternative tryptophan synthase beta-subunit